MATTYSIDNVGGTLTDIDVYILDTATLHQVPPRKPGNGDGARVAVYETDKSAVDVPRLAVTVRSVVDGKKVIHDSVNFSTNSRVVWDSALMLPPTVEPLGITISIHHGDLVEVADVAKALQNVFGLLTGTITAEVPDFAPLSALLNGRVDIFD
jgi:hypothetical protein